MILPSWTRTTRASGTNVNLVFKRHVTPHPVVCIYSGPGGTPNLAAGAATAFSWLYIALGNPARNCKRNTCTLTVNVPLTTIPLADPFPCTTDIEEAIVFEAEQAGCSGALHDTPTQRY